MTSDEALMLEFQGGSRAAFEELFARYHKPLLGFFGRRLNNIERAEDLTPFGPKTQCVPTAAHFSGLSVGCGIRQCAAGPAFLTQEYAIGPVHFGYFGASFNTNWRTYAPVTMMGVSRGVDGSGRVAVVVVQHAAQALPPLDFSCATKVARFWADELVR